MPSEVLALAAPEGRQTSLTCTVSRSSAIAAPAALNGTAAATATSEAITTAPLHGFNAGLSTSALSSLERAQRATCLLTLKRQEALERCPKGGGARTWGNIVDASLRAFKDKRREAVVKRSEAELSLTVAEIMAASNNSPHTQHDVLPLATALVSGDAEGGRQLGEGGNDGQEPAVAAEGGVPVTGAVNLYAAQSPTAAAISLSQAQDDGVAVLNTADTREWGEDEGAGEGQGTDDDFDTATRGTMEYLLDAVEARSEAAVEVTGVLNMMVDEIEKEEEQGKGMRYDAMLDAHCAQSGLPAPTAVTGTEKGRQENPRLVISGLLEKITGSREVSDEEKEPEGEEQTADDDDTKATMGFLPEAAETRAEASDDMPLTMEALSQLMEKNKLIITRRDILNIMMRDQEYEESLVEEVTGEPRLPVTALKEAGRAGNDGKENAAADEELEHEEEQREGSMEKRTKKKKRRRKTRAEKNETRRKNEAAKAASKAAETTPASGPEGQACDEEHQA